MKKKYLAYALSAAMLTSMMPTTSVYAQVAKGEITIVKADVDNGFTDAGGKSTIAYSNDGAATNVKFKVENTAAADATNVTVKIYKKGATDAEKNTGSGTLNATTANSTADVEVDIDGLAAGEYTAKATIDNVESDAGVEFTVTPKPITAVTDVTLADKTYDGTNTVDVTKLNDDSAVFTGVEDKDKANVRLDKTADKTAATYADANVGNDKNVTFSKVGLTGKDAANYTLETSAITGVKGNITKATPTLGWNDSLNLGGKEGSVTAPKASDVKGAPAGTDVTFKYYTAYTSADVNTPTNTTDNSGASAEGGVPTKKGNYFVVASIAGTTNYKAASTAAQGFNITAGDAQATTIKSVALEGLVAPVTKAAPITKDAISDKNNTGKFTVKGIAWSPQVDTFKKDTAYTATITLIPKDKDTADFTATSIATVDAGTVKKITLDNKTRELSIEVEFPKTTALKLALKADTTLPTASEIFFGEKLASSNITSASTVVVDAADNQTTIAGSWAWAKDAAEPTTVGTHKAKAVFTASGDNANYYDVLEQEVTVNVKQDTVTVKAKDPAAFNSADAIATLKDKVTVVGTHTQKPVEGTFEWYKTDVADSPLQDLKAFSSTSDKDKVSLYYKFTPADANYEEKVDKTTGIEFTYSANPIAVLAFDKAEVRAEFGAEAKDVQLPTLKKDDALTVKYEVTPPGVVTVNADTGALESIATVGTATVTVSDTAVDTLVSPASYTIVITEKPINLTVEGTTAWDAVKDKTKDPTFTLKALDAQKADMITNLKNADQFVYVDKAGAQQTLDYVKTHDGVYTVKSGATANANYKIGNHTGLQLTITGNGNAPIVPGGSGGSSGSSGSSGGSSNNSTTKSSVYVDNSGASKNGTVKISNKNAKAGDKVTLTVKPDKGYELDKIIVKDRDGNKIEVKEEKDGKFTFIMPKGGKVDITPTFTKVEEKKEEETKDDTQKNPIDMNTSRTFNDVRANDWFKAAVDYVVSEGIMSGVGDRDFAPNDNMTRAMVWQVLAKLDGVNTAGGAKWYSKAMDWAMTHKITDGSNVDGEVTREQLASMLYRYAKDSGMDVSVKGTLTNFPDAKEANSYAAEALQWAVGAGLINGMDGKLNPQGNATRAQVATILMNFNKLSK